jgi:hypothetical protein
MGQKLTEKISSSHQMWPPEHHFSAFPPQPPAKNRGPILDTLPSSYSYQTAFLRAHLFVDNIETSSKMASLLVNSGQQLGQVKK